MKSKGTSRKEEIIQIAAKLFADKGYHGATLDDVAGQLNLTKPALYYHISSKESILREILNKVMKHTTREVLRISKSSMPPRDKMRIIIRKLIEINTESKYMIAITFEQSSAVPARTYKAVTKQKKAVEYILQDILREGTEQGCFAIDDVKMASYVILGATTWTYRWYHPEGRLTPEQIADKFIDYLENGYIRR